MLADWGHALKEFRQLIPIAVTQPAPAREPVQEKEGKPVTRG
jgi:hypothetical protein